MSDVLLTWDGPDGDGELAEPSRADLESRLRDLDGGRRTIVMLQRDADFFAAGGSVSDGLVVYVQRGDDTFFQALSPDDDSTETVVVVAGGQPGDYESRFVTTYEVALAAGTRFLESGELAPDVRWEQT